MNVPQFWFFSVVSPWLDSGYAFFGRITGFILIFFLFILVTLTVRTWSSTYIIHLINAPSTWLFISCIFALCVDILLIPTGHWTPCQATGMPSLLHVELPYCSLPCRGPCRLYYWHPMSGAAWHPPWSGVNQVPGINQTTIAAPSLDALLISPQSWHSKSGCHSCSWHKAISFCSSLTTWANRAIFRDDYPKDTQGAQTCLPLPPLACNLTLPSCGLAD